MTDTIDHDGEGRIAAAGAQVRETLASAAERVSDVAGSAAESASAAYSTARDKASDSFGSVSKRASEAYATARDRAAAAGTATGAGVQDYPAIAVIGAVAVGAVAAALLPRSAREATLLAPIGARLGDLVKAAAASAKEAGVDALGEAGVNRDAARSQVDKLLDIALGAVKAAGGAAAETVRRPA